MKIILTISKFFDKLDEAYSDLCKRIGSIVSPF
jgi:hypothetical protein